MTQTALNDFDRQVLQIITDNPGAWSFLIHHELIRTWKWRKRLGDFWSHVFGPSTGRMYVSLAKLEGGGLVEAWWGNATESRGWHRRRHYRAISKAGG